MLNHTRFICLTLLAVSGCVIAADVPYPKGYRSWAHVKSMVLEQGHPLFAAFGGIHHIYANPKAMAGYKTGQWADGAVIVFDLLDAKRGGNAVVEGSRKVVGVMHRDSKRFAATGGWGYEGFKGDSETERAVGANAATACHSCHEAQKAKGFVFSETRK